MDNVDEKIESTSESNESVVESTSEGNNTESILDSNLQDIEATIMDRLDEEKRNKIDREQLDFEKEMFSQMQEYAQLAGLVKKYKS